MIPLNRLWIIIERSMKMSCNAEHCTYLDGKCDESCPAYYKSTDEAKAELHDELVEALELIYSTEAERLRCCQHHGSPLLPPSMYQQKIQAVLDKCKAV